MDLGNIPTVFKELFVKPLLLIYFLKNNTLIHFFINHKTKDYVPGGAGLSNLSMSTLKEYKSHD